MQAAALEFFEKEDYQQAFPIYSQLLSLKLQSPEYNFRFGACHLFTEETKDEALKYLKFAADHQSAPPLAYFYYGLGLHLNYQFDRAIDQYQKYKEVSAKKEQESALVDTYIAQCVSGKSLVSSFTDISVVQREVLPRTEFYRNYDLSDFGGKIIIKPEDFMSEEDKERDAKFLMYFQQNSDYIYYASYSEKNATGKDLYVIQKLPTGDWSTPTRLSDVINTPLDEDYAFIHPEGNVLYFASEGHNSMGGYDIFKSTRRGDGSWTQPINMEFAINTPWDDFMFITDKEENAAWFSSNRETGSKEVTLYKIGIQRIPLDLTLIKGTFESEGSRKAKITVEDMVQNKVVGVFDSERQLGAYLLDLRGSGKYQFIVEAEESSAVHRGIVEIPREKGLKQFRQEMRLVKNNGREELQIINHFDEPLGPDESLLTADILKKQASLSVNANEGDIVRTTEIIEGADPVTDSGNEDLPRAERLDQAKLTVSELQGDAELMNQKAAYLYNKANELASSSDPNDLAEAAIAAELATIYKGEADSRETAANRMQGTINAIEEPSLSDEAFNAQYNQLSTTADNFNPLDDFEAGVTSDFEKRMDPTIALYEEKKAEVDELESDLSGIDEEIAYYRTEIENTRDDAIKEELNIQIEEAQAARPEKEASLDRAQSELDDAETQKNNAESYFNLATTLLTTADGVAETITSTVTATEVNQIKSSLANRASGNPALVAFVSPEKAQEAIDQSQQDSRTARDETADASTETDSGTADSGNETNSTSGSESSNTGDAQDTGSNTGDETAGTDSGASETGTTGSETTGSETADVGTTATTTTTDGNETNSTELNDEIREITATPSEPDIIPGDYGTALQNQINEAANAEDPIIAETRKAEIYDQWVDNIQYRIDSLQKVQDEEPDPDRKLNYANQIAELNTEKQEKEDLAMSSYENIATLSDAEAAMAEANPTGTETGSTQPTGQETPGTETADTGSETTALDGGELPAAVIEINTRYESQLQQAAAIQDPTERKRTEARINKEWADALQEQINELNTQLEGTEDIQEQNAIQNAQAAISEIKLEKQNTSADLSKEIVAEEKKVADARAQNALRQQLYEYVENYNKSAFTQIEEQINVIPDENQRIVQTRTLTRNWIMAIQNEQVKTEAQLRSTDDPNQQERLQTRMAQLNVEKQEVQAKLAAVDGDSTIADGPAAPSSVIVKGSERFEGYVPVEDNTVEEYSTQAATAAEQQSTLQPQVTQLENELAETKKKKVRAELQDEINAKSEQLAMQQMEAVFYDESADAIASVEGQILQLEEGDPKPSEAQLAKATLLQEEADQLTATANTMANEALNVRKKKDRIAAQQEAKEAQIEARVKQREAQLAQDLADRMIKIEIAAIKQNNIIPPGQRVTLPVVTRTLNPNERADLENTFQFNEYNDQRKRSDSIRTEVTKLELLEAALNERAQQTLLQSTSLAGGNNAQNRMALAEQAYVIYDQADSISTKAARLSREAAVIENDANRNLLNNPEEVYMNVLAYYNTPSASGQPDIVRPTAAEIDALVAANNPNASTDAALNGGTDTATDASSTGTGDATTPVNDQPFNLNAPVSNNQTVDVPEDVLTNTIFEITPNATSSSYDDANPIPVDPPMPQGLTYRVQIGAFRSSIDQSAFKGLKPIIGETAGGGLTRYAAGAFTDFASADLAKDEVRDIGYPDAFVVAYLNGERVSVAQARAYEAGGAAPQPIASTGGTRPAASIETEIIERGPLRVQDVQNQSGTFLTVQVGVFSRPVSASEIYNITPLNQENMANGLYRYTTGIYTDENVATQARDEVRSLGITDAFVTAYREGTRVTVNEARQSLGLPASAAQPTTTATTTSTGTSAPSGNFKVALGTYSGDIPVTEASIILRLSSEGVEKVRNADGSSTYFYGGFATRAEAESEANRLKNEGLPQATASE